jgi:hypothetical protein
MASDQEIYDTLSGPESAPAKKSPCGCNEPDMSASAGSVGLAGELESALDALGSVSGGDGLDLDVSSIDEDLLFADAGQEPSITLQDLVSLAEQYPGLKITISF